MTADRMPFVLTIDAEPDSPWPPIDAPDPWLGFESWAEYAGPLRERLEKATGQPVHFTWALRMDDQVSLVYGSPTWAADQYARQLGALTSAGDELGVHPHAWRWVASPGHWLQDHADAAWCAHVVDTSFEAFGQSFGFAPRMHRFGSRFMTPALTKQVERLGGRVDLTMEPGARGMVALEKFVHATGYLPDQRRVPRVPYRPHPSDPLSGSSDGGVGELWMLPGSALDPSAWLPPMRRLGRRLRFLGQPLHRPAELWAPTEPHLFWSTLASAVEALPVRYISLAVRSESLRGRNSRELTSKLDALITDPLIDRVRFTTASEALRQLVGQS